MSLEKIHFNGREKSDGYDESTYVESPRISDGAPVGYHGR